MDLARLVQALICGDKGIFQNPNTYDSLWNLTYADGKYVGGCAHGLWQFEGGSSYIGHDGEHNGYTSYTMFSKNSKCGVIILTNQGS